MLGKLMKYEFRLSMRSLGIVWIAMLSMSLLAGVCCRIGTATLDGSTGKVLALLKGISIFAYAGLIAAAVVITIMIIIRRFNQGLLGDEGYLMHTLPVSKRSLIASKGLVAAVVLLASSLAITLSIVLLNLCANSGQAIEMIKSFFLTVGHYPMTLWFIFEGLILIITWLLIVIYKIYLAMAVGQLSDNHRGLIAIEAYLGINIAESILGFIVGIIVTKLSIGPWLAHILKGMGDYTQTNLAALFIFLVLAIVLVIIHMITETILNKKLNLL